MNHLTWGPKRATEPLKPQQKQHLQHRALRVLVDQVGGRIRSWVGDRNDRALQLQQGFFEPRAAGGSPPVTMLRRFRNDSPAIIPHPQVRWL